MNKNNLRRALMIAALVAWFFVLFFLFKSLPTVLHSEQAAAEAINTYFVHISQKGPVQQMIALSIFFFLFLLVLFLSAAPDLYARWRAARMEKQLAKRLEQAESKAAQEPERAKYVWDIARIRLEGYLDRNLLQISQTFRAAVVSMWIGFLLIMWGVWLSFEQPNITPPTIAAACAGIISEFIGATFVVIYRSTIKQAAAYMGTLDRLNRIGISVQILDSISDTHSELKNEARARLAFLLLEVEHPRTEDKTASLKARAGDL